MLLHFGCVPVLVVSSADAAQDILKTHDRVFASRPRSKIFRNILHYDGRDVALAPYGEYWRQKKSVCVLHLLSNKMVRSFQDVRKEEIRIVMEKIRKSSSSSRINLTKLVAGLTDDVRCRVAFGNKYGGDTDFMELTARFEKLMGSFSVGTFEPWLAWIDWISGLDAEVENTKNDFDEFLERVVQDHTDGSGDKNDFVHVLLAIQRERSIGFEIDRISINAIIMNIFVGGTNTSFAVMEWAMTELLRHPECLNILQKEVRGICKGKSNVFEEKIQDMKYLKAVIKETMRLHPPVPLLVPHESTHDVRLRDYYIPTGTHAIINAWAIEREAATWGPDAELFRPERHLDRRRICPAISFAVVLIELALANLVHQFDWRSTDDHTDVPQAIGVGIHRMFPLYVIASSTTLLLCEGVYLFLRQGTWFYLFFLPVVFICCHVILFLITCFVFFYEIQKTHVFYIGDHASG
ncbi:hypothetical protein Bca4012_025906 [Brassica carinata]|uniref:Uncharacterized protein n=1 Tax=Brassica carinata TaxID=52824 RepID=A0A8X8ATY9_BRACI|nr:hypothetical protein Bca52824_022935 [Brassica carinata]